MNKLIQNKIFHYDTIVSIQEDDGEVLDLLDIYDIEDLHSDVAALDGYTNIECRTELVGNKKIVTRFNQIPEPWHIAHEIVHIIGYIFKDLEIPLSDDTEEIRAYLTEFYTLEIFKLIEEQNKTCEELKN